MANSTTKNAPKSNVAPNNDVPDFSTWSDIQIGFAPYWTPAIGKFFLGTPIARDERNPDFVRYLIQAGMDVECQRGPNDDSAEKVIVRKGETFSISVYYQLAEEFNFQLEEQIGVPVRVEATKKARTKDGQDVWNFRMQCETKHKQMMDGKRQAWRLARNSSQGEDRQLES